MDLRAHGRRSMCSEVAALRSTPNVGSLLASRSSAATVMVCTALLYGTAADAKEITFNV